MSTKQRSVTRLLMDWRGGKKEALDELLPLVYRELRRLAVHHLRNERPGHSLQPTALIHEAYLRMVRQEMPDLQNRVHFFGVAAHLMRQILVDHARKRIASKRDGGRAVPLEEAVLVTQESGAELIALDDALTALAEIDSRKCRVIELRYFAGLSLEEVAETLEISVATVTRDLRMAEAWLRRSMRG